MAKDQYIMKDDFFNKETVSSLAGHIASVYSNFEKEAFINNCVSSFKTLELKERLTSMTNYLNTYLPKNFIEATSIITQACQLVNPEEEKTFVYACFLEYVEKGGCNDEHIMLSLELLEQYTKIFSAEFAIRKFINLYPQETYQAILAWSTHPNLHVRRLASEGLRPKLPWAKSIHFDYKKGARPLYNLFTDKHRYVTRSVANHLNDLSKIDADFTLSILKDWMEKASESGYTIQSKKEMNYLINHSLRSLIKKGHKDTLNLLGYTPNPAITMSSLAIKNSEFTIGNSLDFSFDIYAEKKTNLIIDYIITYPNPHKKNSQKVFKLKTVRLKKGEKLSFNKKHLFRLMTTKKLYSGSYSIQIQVNGHPYESASFIIHV